jgi:hypothetical protein
LPSESLREFDRGHRGVTICQKQAKNRINQGSLPRDERFLARTMRNQDVLDPINLLYFSGVRVNPVYHFIHTGICKRFLALRAKIASQIYTPVAIDLSPPIKVDMEMGL